MFDLDRLFGGFGREKVVDSVAVNHVDTHLDKDTICCRRIVISAYLFSVYWDLRAALEDGLGDPKLTSCID